MINPSEIDLFSLPCLPLEKKSLLPAIPCVYFAIDSQGIVQYIGQTKNLKKRWELHHKGIDLALLGGVKISYLCVELSLLEKLESAFIHLFKPPFNKVIKKERVEDERIERVAKVTKTISIEVPNLGAKIKEARERDYRLLKAICEAVGMSQMNWYRIEDEKQSLPLETLRKIEKVLEVDFGVEMSVEGEERGFNNNL